MYASLHSLYQAQRQEAPRFIDIHTRVAHQILFGPQGECPSPSRWFVPGGLCIVFERYKVVSPDTWPSWEGDPKDGVKRIADEMKWNEHSDYELGKRKFH